MAWCKRWPVLDYAKQGYVNSDDMTRPLNLAAATLEDSFGRPRRSGAQWLRHRGHRSDHIGDRAEIDRPGRCRCRQLGGRPCDYGSCAILMVGALNPISLAFAVLFVGLGADFAIQYTVRYRAERHDLGRLDEALIGSAAWVGIPFRLRPGRRRLDFCRSPRPRIVAWPSLALSPASAWSSLIY